MKAGLALLLCAAAAFCAEQKPLPNQAGNDDLDVYGDVMIERQQIQQALGADLGPGYIVVQLRVLPKGKALRVTPDDFTLLSHKDGQRSAALEPGQIAGKGALVVKPASEQPGGDGTATNGPIWAGVTVKKGGAGDPALMQKLKAKEFPDRESTSPIEGLLYFEIDGKLKTKDLSLLYNGQGGRLVMDFK